MPSKNTSIVTIRMPDAVLNEIKYRIAKQQICGGSRSNENGLTLNQWMNKAAKESIRSHRKG